MDVEFDSDLENDSAELLQPSANASNANMDTRKAEESNRGSLDTPDTEQRSEAALKEEISFSAITNDQNLAVDITMRVSFLQMAIAPSLSDNLTSSGSSLGASALASPTIAHSSIPGSVFNLESLADPSKSNRSYAFIRFMDFQIASRQTSHGELSIQATLAALAVHERYKVTVEKLAQVPEGAVIGEKESNSSYLTYPVLRVHHPHGFGKNKAEGKGSSDNFAMRIRHATEHRVPTTSFDMDQISLTLPGRLPLIIDKALRDVTEAFSRPSEVAGNQKVEDNPKLGSSSLQLPQSTSSSSSSIPKDQLSPDHAKFAGLVDSSSSSGSSLTVSSASLPKHDARDDSSQLKEEEAPPPSKQMVKLGHLFITLRFPAKISSEEKLFFPAYSSDFLGIYVAQPSITMYSTTGGDHSEAPPDSVEFQTISVHLLKAGQDITNMARISPSGTSKRGSGSDTAVPKPFLKVTANALNSELHSETITISRRSKPLSPQSFAEYPHEMVLDYSRAPSSGSLPPSSSNPHNPPHSRYDTAFSSQQRPQSPTPPTAAAAAAGPTSNPKFVNRSFDMAPFSSMAAKFEGDQQIPSSMDDETYESFRTAVLSNSDMAMTITVHEFHLELEKPQCDLIQDLVDSLSTEPEASSDEKMEEIPHPMRGLMSPLAMDFRINFASFNLGVDHNEYRFSNVENTRILFVNQYLRTSKTFVVVQVGALRLPSVDPIPNSPPTLSKIPDFNSYDRSNVLQVIFVTESLSLEGEKQGTDNKAIGSFAPSLSNPAQKDPSQRSRPINKNHDEEDQPSPKSRMTVLVETNRMAIDHRLGERWIGDLSGFFVREGPVDLSKPKTEILLFAHAKNSSLALRGNIATNQEYLQNNPMPGDPILLLHMEKLVLHSRILVPSDPLLNNRLVFHLRLQTAQLFLIDDKGRVWLKPYEDPHVKTMRQYWLSRGYAPAGYIESLFAKISLNSISLPNFSLDLNLNGILDTSGDQVYTLLQLLTSLSSPIPSQTPIESSYSSVPLSSSSTESSNLQITDFSSNPPSTLPTFAFHDSSSDLRSSQSLDQLQAVEVQEDDEMEVIGGPKAQSAPVASIPNAEQYVLVKLTPEQMKQREAELEQQHLLRAFKMAKPPSTAPIARFVASTDGSVPTRMPKLMENYRPSKKVEQIPLYTMVFNLNSESLVWRLREGVSLSDLDPQAPESGDKSLHNGPGGTSSGISGLHKDYRDVLSGNPAKYVDINLKGLRLLHTSDAMDQTDLLLKVKRFYFTSAMDASGPKPFVDLDRTAHSLAPYMLSLRLSTLHDLQHDASPALRPTGLGVAHPSSSRSLNVSQQASSSKSNQGSISKRDSRTGEVVFEKTSDTALRSSSKSDPMAKNGEKEEASSILVFSSLPLSIRVDIEALDFMRSFYSIFVMTKPQGPPYASKQQNANGRGAKGEGRKVEEEKRGPYFHRVSISAISLNLNVSAWAVRMDDAVIKLPSIYSRGVEGWEGIGSELSAVYSPLLYSSLFTFAGALPVVRLVTSILGSVSNLVINPYHEYQQGRSAAAGAYGAITVGATSVTSELLRFGAWVTSTAGDGLQYLESFWRTPDSVRTTAPANVQQGAQLGYANVVRQVAAARDCLVVMPWREYERTQSVVGLVAGLAGAVPLAILKPVIGATHGLSNVMQGASNAIHVPGRTRDPIPATATLGTSPGPSPSPSAQSSSSPNRR